MPNSVKLKRILLNCIVSVVFMGAFLSPCSVAVVDVTYSTDSEPIYSAQQQKISKKIATALVPTSNGMQVAAWYQSDDVVEMDRRIALHHDQSERPSVQVYSEKQSSIWVFVAMIIICLMLFFLFGYCTWRLNMLVRSLLAMIFL
ncbi:hypothetical protein [Gynuella sp.]|uniref:hypothetical protein n=1 Tax=Gynuella sp. TaxID=2969146 RepID=UPI003D1343E7